MLLTKEEFSKVSEQIRDTFIDKIEEDMKAEGEKNFWWNKFKWCRTEYFPCVVSPILRFKGEEEIDHFLKFKELPNSMEKIGIGALDNTCVDEFRKMLGYPTVPSGTIEDIVKHMLSSPHDPTFDQPILLTIALFTEDSIKAKEFIVESKRLNESHGDWDHRNRLKVYEAMYLMAIRDINGASTLLESCIATFTCNEMCTYNQFMFYALLASLMHLPRTQLKKKIIDNPQVISVIKEVPCMYDLLHSFHNCDYGKYMKTVSFLFYVM